MKKRWMQKTLSENDDALGDVICDAQINCKSEKKKAKFDQMLEDHKKLLYPSVEDGEKKLDDLFCFVCSVGQFVGFGSIFFLDIQ